MRTARARLLALVPFASLIVTLGCGPPAPDELADPVIVRRGAGGAGRLLAVQLFATSLDYASAASFEAMVRAHLDSAKDEGLLDAQTVVVLPEYAGSWLVVQGEGAGIYEKDTIGDAMTDLALAHLPAFLWAQLTAPEGTTDGSAHAAFSIKSEQMAAAYQETLGALAEDFGVTLVGGSILLPSPRLNDGALEVKPGAALENVSGVFAADGDLIALSKKVHPTADELPFVNGADVTDIAVVDTPAGRLGVLVCADAWFPDAYAHLKAEGAELLAVPTFHTGGWKEDWKGYSGAPEPDDVDADDIGEISEAAAWDRYALASRAPAVSLRGAVSSPLRGSLWDLHDDGQAFLVDGAGFERAPLVDGPGLFSLELSPTDAP